MNADRIKEIQSKTAYPDSISVQQALMQVWRESERASDTTVYHVPPGAWRCPACGAIVSAGQYHDCKDTTLRARLEISTQLINDFMAVFYPDWVNDAVLAEANTRVKAHNSMLAYIADVLKDNKAALHEVYDVPLA